MDDLNQVHFKLPLDYDRQVKCSRRFSLVYLFEQLYPLSRSGLILAMMWTIALLMMLITEDRGNKMDKKICSRLKVWLPGDMGLSKGFTRYELQSQ